MSITTGLCLAFILGCTKAPVEVNSLGLKLSAPQLKSSSPFEQDMESNGFVVLSGTCNKMMTKFSVSTDGETFYDIPPSTPYTVAGVAGTKTNKTDCADGTFEFYLSDALIESWLGSSENINKIFLRSEGALGVSENLVLIDTKDKDGGGGSRPTQYKISKEFPRGLVGDNTCGAIEISLTDSSGNEGSLSQATTFELKEGNFSSALSFYEDLAQCQTSVSTSTTLTAQQIGTIPANRSRKTIYYHFQFPPSDTFMNLRVDNTNAALNLSSATTVVEKRNSDPSSTQRWLSFDGMRNIYKNTCVQGRVGLRKYDVINSGDNTHGPIISTVLSSSDTKLKFFSDANCSNPIADGIVSFEGMSPGPVEYEKNVYYTYTSSDPTGEVKATVTFAPNGTSGYSIDAASEVVRIDLDSSRNTIAQIQIEGPQNIDEMSCHQYTIRSLNSRYAAVANTTAAPLVFNLNSTSTGTSGFFSDNTCNTPITQESILPSEQSKSIYFKVYGAYNSTLQATLAATPTVSTQMTAVVNPVASVMQWTKTDVTPSYIALAAGSQFLCANDSLNNTYCAGMGASGQLGDEGYGAGHERLNLNFPTGNFIKIDAGYNHACGITTDGSLYCWGNNYYGQLGTGIQDDANIPALINPANSYVEVSGGYYYTCAITTSGIMKCWGQNSAYQLGDGSSNDRLSPTSINSGTTYKKVSAGFSSTCAITTLGKIHCWGSNNSTGRLGLGVTATQSTPAEVSVAGETFNEISVAANYACAISSSNQLYCWGTYHLGTSSAPVKVAGVFANKISSFTDNHSCLLNASGEVRCWGINAFGQVGDGTVNSPIASPIKVSGADVFTDIVTGENFTCGLRLDTTLNKQILKCWGSNSSGQYGIGTKGSGTESFVPAEHRCYHGLLKTYDWTGQPRSIKNYPIVNISSGDNSAFIGPGDCFGAITASYSPSMSTDTVEFYFRQKKPTINLNFYLSVPNLTYPSSDSFTP